MFSARVASASAQVGVDGPRFGLEKLSGGMDGLIICLALNCWWDWVREACHEGLDSGVLHCIGRTGVPICFAGVETFWSGGQIKS
jgi:hypothetical protein